MSSQWHSAPKRCGPLADHGLHAVREAFEDGEHGGWFPEVSGDGPVRVEKEA